LERDVSRLTKRKIESAAPHGEEYFLWCSSTPGFRVRIYPSGKKTFVLQFRVDSRATRRMKIGPYGPYTVEQARRRAQRQAREDQADTLADEIITIADSVRECADSAKVNAARLAVDARKWVAAKLKPKVYGERVEAALSGTATVQHKFTDEDRAKALEALIARHLVRSAPNLIEAQRLLENKGAPPDVRALANGEDPQT
jgi:Bacteriophage Sf6, terminase small subunit-like/Arm DNA-binding domain